MRNGSAGDGGVGRGATRVGRHADACRRVAFRGCPINNKDHADVHADGDGKVVCLSHN
jgi:hypothetical protein